MSYIKSPLNYTGGKFKILEPIISAFPKQIDTFVDLFAGGFNVGINVPAKNVICNDHINYLIELFEYFYSYSSDVIIDEVKNKINEYQLSLNNVEGYNSLRKHYNQEKEIVDFFVLTCFSFNHQIRFNNKHEFNTPFGKDRSSYNDRIEKNLINFCKSLHNMNVTFSNKDFTAIDLSKLGNNDLVYCDPPYLISTGSYNDGKRGFKDWTDTEEEQLLNLLDSLTQQNVKFALSNVLYHKGETNVKLIKWSEKYNTTYIDKSYSNCSYHFKDRDAKTVEVLITNYKGDKVYVK